MTRSIWCEIVMLALVAAACGGTQEEAADAGDASTGIALGTNPCPNSLESAGYAFSSLVDFEDGLAPGFNATTSGAPATSAPALVPGGRVCGDGQPSGSTRALHVEVSGLTGWGLSITVKINPAFDASSWDGLSFWARRGPGDVGRAMSVGVADWQTTQLSDAVADPSRCCFDIEGRKCDSFGVGIGLGEEWRLFKIPFSSMAQQGWGLPADCLDTAEVRALTFGTTAGDWDFWIDDIASYRAPADAGVAPYVCNASREDTVLSPCTAPPPATGG